MNTGVNRFGFLLLSLICALAASSSASFGAGDDPASPDSTMSLKGGEEGTVFKSLTVEGEDRVRIEFERPALVIDLDPTGAPGLDWDNTWDVLGRCDIDFISPLIALSALERSPYLPRPWLQEFVVGDVVRFRPALKDVDRWKMTVADSRGQTVAVFEGKGEPPKEIGWTGRSLNGDPMPPGLTYSYVLEAYDRAGNKRNFVGEGFSLPSYQIESDEELVLVFSGAELGAVRSWKRPGNDTAPAILLDAASRINQLPRGRLIRVGVTARTFNAASTLAAAVVEALDPLLLGDPNLIQPVTDVQKDAPAEGTIEIVVSP